MSDSTLTELQRDVLELFFKLPEADGFVLAGGAALVASGLTERPTQDVDLFGSDVATGITAAADALEVACTDRGWTTERIRDAATFRRLIVRSPGDELLVDLAGEMDEGFTLALLAEMLASHVRFADDDLTDLGGDPPQLRAWADAWRSQLNGGDQR